MKVRNGFVSNSSSSSFCIYGAYMDIDELVEKLKNSNLLTEDELEEMEEDGYDGLDEVFSDKDLEFYISEDCTWIGKSWDSIEDDQTGGEFKKLVQTKLWDLLGTDVECSTHNEEIYN